MFCQARTKVSWVASSAWPTSRSRRRQTLKTGRSWRSTRRLKASRSPAWAARIRRSSSRVAAGAGSSPPRPPSSVPTAPGVSGAVARPARSRRDVRLSRRTATTAEHRPPGPCRGAPGATARARPCSSTAGLATVRGRLPRSTCSASMQGLPAHDLDRALGVVGRVRRQDDVRQGVEGRVGRQRLRVDDVEAGAGEASLPATPAARAGRSTIGPRAVLTRTAVGFIRASAAGVDQAARLRRQRAVDGDDVGACSSSSSVTGSAPAARMTSGSM